MLKALCQMLTFWKNLPNLGGGGGGGGACLKPTPPPGVP